MNNVYIIIMHKPKRGSEVVHVDYNRERALDKFDECWQDMPEFQFEFIVKGIHE